MYFSTLKEMSAFIAVVAGLSGLVSNSLAVTGIVLLTGAFTIAAAFVCVAIAERVQDAIARWKHR